MIPTFQFQNFKAEKGFPAVERTNPYQLNYIISRV
ncbi:hypothetical protein cd3_091 [Carnobacterium phage cd3]|uniref:Uncharacterized protein n=1 Tax=Carnobacterium phage cd2 TaxID=2849244 RepID=A0AAE7SNK7_9CAUD|nr:hypothetical protein PQD68_gp091 [Carnobacterium phage cd2]QXP45217.1 hypothetical protein cd2_091 [Carnobacterium phage cd2]QXP45228.1 hypothetical protein cd3_091 [Carnobacterium phage cd3]